MSTILTRGIILNPRETSRHSKEQKIISLIIISGPPGVGKTTLSHRLATDLGLPVLNRDFIKEAMFDELGYSDRARSVELGKATMAVLFRQLSTLLEVGCSCIVEGNFRPVLEAYFAQLSHKFEMHLIQVQCEARGELLLARFTDRAVSGNRHPGHCDATNIEEFRDELLRGQYPAFELPGTVIEHDLTEFTEVSYQLLLEQIRVALTNSAANN